MTDATQPRRVRELVFADDPERKPRLYACSRCGIAHSPLTYAAGSEEERHAAARQAAENCYTCRDNSTCQGCGASCEKEYTKCSSCRSQDRIAGVDAKIAKARRVTNLEHCFDAYGDAFYSDIYQARDAGATVVFGAKFVPFRADFGQITEELLDGHHEDASLEDLKGLDELSAAIDRFNEAQTSGSYEPDETVYEIIPHRHTFAMIKPDATERGVEEAMKSDIQAAGLRILEERRLTLDVRDAEWLYREHERKEHFRPLVEYTVSGEVVLLLLEGDSDNTPAAFRALMGPTDRTKAGPETLRAKYAVGYRENSIHGSDGPASAINEICHFFPKREALFEDVNEKAAT